MTAGRKNVSIKKDWNTPPKYSELVHEFFNRNLQLDPCSNENSLIQSQNSYSLPINGLLQSWSFETIFVNPPYGRNSESKTSLFDWILKGVEANKMGFCRIRLKYSKMFNYS